MLEGLEDVLDFVDDFLVLSRSVREHFLVLRKLLMGIRAAGATVKFLKVELFRRGMKFLGHILTPNGVKIDPSKVQGIREFIPPRNLKQLRGFLGLANFTAKYTNQIAHESRPLYELLKAGRKWEWGSAQQTAVERMKDLFCKDACLYYPVKDREFVLFTDASDFCMGSLLCQEDEEGKLRIVACASKTFNLAEQSYFATEKELNAIKWSLIKYRMYLLGGKVVVKSDHKSLQFLFSCQHLSGRLYRWALSISEFAPRIEYIKGKDNIVADALSRMGNPDAYQGTRALIASAMLKEPNATMCKLMRNFQKAQGDDGRLSEIIGKLNSKEEVPGYEIIGNLLCKSFKKLDPKVIVPTALLSELVRCTHEVYCHLGAKKMIKLLSPDFFYPGLKEYISRFVRTCDSCQRNKTYTQSTAAKSRPILPRTISELASVDFMGALPTSVGGVKFILAIHDTFSKVVKLYPIKRATTQIVIQKLFGNYIPTHGKMARISSDHGSQFTSPTWINKLTSKDIRAVFCGVRHAQGNMVERVNKELGRCIRTLSSDKHKNWAAWVGLIEYTLNELPHQTTGFTPNELHFNREPSRPWNNLIPGKLINKFTYEEKLEIARVRMSRIGQVRADKFNSEHKLIHYEKNDQVLVKASNISSAVDNTIAKFLPLYNGPYNVISRYRDCTYLLANLTGQPVKGYFHGSSLRPYFPRNGAAGTKDGQADPQEEAGEETAAPTLY